MTFKNAELPPNMWGVLVQIVPETFNRASDRFVNRDHYRNPAAVRGPEPRPTPTLE